MDPLLPIKTESGCIIDKNKITCPISITALGIAQICSWGSLYYSFPQLALAVENEYGWLKSEIYGALTLGFLLSAIVAVPVGMQIDKGNGRFFMTVGSLIAGAIFIVGSQLSSLIWFYIVFAGIGILHSSTLYGAAFSIIAENFHPADTKRHITSLTLWGGFAATVFIPLNQFLLEYLNWRNLMVILGLINIFLCAAIYSRLPNKRQCQQNMASFLPNNGNKDNSKAKKPTEHGIKWALGQPVFWALLICFALYAATSAAFKFHLYPMLIEKGLSIEEVVTIVAILGPAQVAGRSLLWFFSEKISTVKLGIFVSAVLPIVFTAYAFLPTGFWLFIPFAIAFGTASGIMTIVKGVSVPELLTSSSYGAINGAMNVPINIISAFAPALAALAWTITNNYSTLLNILIIAGLGVVLSFSLASFIKSPNAQNKTLQQ